MTTITINEIRITSSQIIAKINDNDTYLELFDLSQIMRHITEKTITILSREYHKHNDLESFRNNFQLKLSRVLHNANYNVMVDFKTKKFLQPYWVIEDQHFTKNRNFIIVTLRNLINEKLEDE